MDIGDLGFVKGNAIRDIDRLEQARSRFALAWKSVEQPFGPCEKMREDKGVV